MLEIVKDYQSRGVIVCFVKLREKCKAPFERSGLYSLVQPRHFFRKIRDAIDYLKAENLIASRDAECRNLRSPSSVETGALFLQRPSPSYRSFSLGNLNTQKYGTTIPYRPLFVSPDGINRSPSPQPYGFFPTVRHQEQSESPPNTSRKHDEDILSLLSDSDS